MLPGALDDQASQAWQAFFEALQAGGRAAHAFGAAGLPLPLPIQQLLGMDGPEPAPPEAPAPGPAVQAPAPPHANGIHANGVRERFPLGAAIRAFGKIGQIVGYNDHTNGTHVLADLGNGTPASFDPDNPPG